MSKEYRNTLGWTNKAKFIQYLKASDIVRPNWEVIRLRNERLSNIFNTLNSVLKYPSNVDIDVIINRTTETVKANGILTKLNNHGRAIEDVYYTWLQGYLAEIVFQPLMVAELGLTDLMRNGGDDLSDPASFKRTGAADLVSHENKVLIDVQAGFSGSGGFDIKKHKVNEACANPDYQSYVFFANIVDGTYHFQDLKLLENEEFIPNPRWEGQLCWNVSPDNFKTFW